MPFMEMEILRDKVVLIETNSGEFAFPYSVTGDISDSQAYAYIPPGMTIEKVEILSERYIGRYSASGYMDCTDWDFGTNRRKLEKHLREMYG